MSELVKQPTMKPTRKVAMGAVNGAGALVGVNVLLLWAVGRAYGPDGMMPKDLFDVLIWVNGIVTVAWQTFAGWFVREVRPRLMYAIEEKLDDVLPRRPPGDGGP